ncbi:MAG: pyrroline-5-carboxylate reductase [Limnochordaceae bacterium]|nr:pyrroline-5-carboxylate reductase [Limnochordaceae bacterium]
MPGEERRVKVGTLGVLGAGAMGGALLRGVLRAGLVPPQHVWVVEPDSSRRQQVQTELGVSVLAKAGPELGQCQTILVAVKPQVWEEALEQARPFFAPKVRVLSIVAGVRTQQLAARLPAGATVVRAMPNMPALVGAGATAICGTTGAEAGEAETEALAVAKEIFGAVGRVVQLSESALDAVTGLSGSGPAYVFLMIEALADGGVSAGLSREVSELLAAQTVLGAAQAVLETKLSPAVLRTQVMSPAGTTAAGLRVLEQRAVRAALIDAVLAAAERSQQLGAAGHHASVTPHPQPGPGGD